MIDPYLSWLGITTRERPLGAHQLLGVKAEEKDPRVLEEAALARMGQVRRFQLRYPEEATRLLNEIAQSLNHTLKSNAYQDSSAPLAPAADNVLPSSVFLTALVLDAGGGEDQLAAYRVELRAVPLSPSQRRRLVARFRSGADAAANRPQVRLVLHGGLGDPSRKFLIPRRIWRAFQSLFGTLSGYLTSVSRSTSLNTRQIGLEKTP